MSNCTKERWALSPLENDSIGDVVAVDEQGEITRYICEVETSGKYDDEIKAEARLIAAAPEMYRILRKVQELCGEVDLDPDIECDIWQTLCYVDGKEAKF